MSRCIDVADVRSAFSRPPQDAEQLHPAAFPLELAGDFYAQPESVVRGLPMGLAQLQLPESHGCGFPQGLSGDFYAQEDDVVRSCAAFQFEDLLGQKSGSLKGADPILDKKSYFLSRSDLRPFSQNRAAGAAERRLGGEFAQTDHPPALPQDTYFQLEVTTVYFVAAAAYDIGNRLLEFLEREVVADITKLSPRKFAIRADVFFESLMCSLKIRCYSTEAPGEYAIEFQRRQGDCMTFNRSFAQAAQYLATYFAPLGGHACSSACNRSLPGDLFAVPALFPGAVPDEAPAATVAAPLLAMARLGSVPTCQKSAAEPPSQGDSALQAEAAAALAQMAGDDTIAGALCTPEVFAELASLLRAARTDVAYPAAQALERLGPRAEAGPCLQDEGLAEATRDAMQAATTDGVVHRCLAHALKLGAPGPARAASVRSDKASEASVAAHARRRVAAVPGSPRSSAGRAAGLWDNATCRRTSHGHTAAAGAATPVQRGAEDPARKAQLRV